MTFTVSETLWVTLRKGDPSFQLQGDFTVANRASLEITTECPAGYVHPLANAIKQGWIRPVAVVPKTDPTLMWDTLKNE
jgi:hypothetical protein